ncbi:matrixin family metalloprotease [Actinomadura chibensis]|uniref:Matrixin family metalloprotease n=1 Tax=Actinomadura chibensis TaxID=392828 RepID=A0A5D0NXW1_9ACTN|nr:matrixin family metalloprotease [Actinomadura chibensis]TYB48969.1 matrixin family metalloprotease [Actinomadura chibensis]
MHAFSRAALAVALPAAAALAAAATAAAPAAGAGRAPAWCKPGGTLSARAMPQRVRIADCDLRGRTVRGENGLTAVVPADGTSLIAYSTRTGGGTELSVAVDGRARAVTILSRGGRVPEGRPRASRAPLDPCQDTTYRTEPARWPKGSTVEWRYHPGTDGRRRDPVARGVANMAGANTDCTAGRRYAPPPDVRQRYAGDSSTGPNITADAACGARDGANTFGWRSMTGAEGDVLAATCVWYRGSTTVETDMALQEQGKRWWTGGACAPGSYSVESVVTHESGHVFGLAHVDGPDHSRLTMAPSVGSCDDFMSTLGRGDYEGLISLYGGR